MPKSVAIASIAGAVMLAAGCATNAPAPEQDVQMVKIYRTGSKLPVLVPYMGAEHLKYIEAMGDRDAAERIVSPPQPIRSN